MQDVGTCLGRKGEPREKDPMWVGCAIEVSTGMGRRVILAGKSQRKKHVDTDYREIYYRNQANFLLTICR